MSLSMKIKKDWGNFYLDIELDAENEVLALLGASGCGKSMTLRCIAGVVTPDEGYIIVNGKTLFDSKKKINLPPQKRHVGLLFQNYALFPNMTVEQNILTGMTGQTCSQSEKKRICHEIMGKFYLTELAGHRPAQLSGGQQQRVALSRILISKPDILMLDEPFSALDSYLRWELEQELMRVISEFSGTSLLVSHNRDEVFRISKRIAVIDNGHVDVVDHRMGLFYNPRTYQSALLTGCKNFSAAKQLGDGRIEATDWGITLRCARPLPADLTHIGMRAHNLCPALSETENVTRCKVLRAVDNRTEMIVMLATPAGRGDSSPLYMDIPMEDWDALGAPAELPVYFPSEDILPLI